ncbi:cytoplasmic protein NCK2-like [Daphnia carinata]|uniref:cytoplasmic protein NCK2-like n=1 Tax=Daphnia carinata TaxID=120202 RepID=UPI00257F4ECB|nr:cytoplasmic protein NCK2-like [Daphnia carinata]
MSNSLKMGKAIEDCYVIAKYDYVAQGSQELSLRKNDKLLLLDDSKHWWKVQNSQHQWGYVPSNYVKKEKPSIFDSIKKRVKKGNSINKSSTSPGGSPVREVDSPGVIKRPSPDTSHYPTHDLNAGPHQGWALVRYNYTAQQTDELSLVKGTKVLVLEKSSDGWWKGQYQNQIGWFPSNYTLPDSLQQPATNMTASVAPPAASAMVMSAGEHMYSAAENVLDVVVALYSFVAQNNEELSFVKGERLEILDRPPADPDWYRARNTLGSIGLIPKNYVQEISDFLTEPFRQRAPGNGAPAGPSAVSHLPHTVNNGNNAVDGMGRSLDALSLNVPPSTSANSSQDPSFPHLKEKHWFYGAITRSECDNLLNQYGQDGDFLVRSSETNVGDYSVSLKAPGRNKHFRVHVEGALYVIGQRRFHSIDQLVDHYQRSPIFTSDKGERLFLIRPLPKPVGYTPPPFAPPTPAARSMQQQIA